MAIVLKDRVKVLATTTGTGAFTLGSAVTGYQSFSVIGDGNSTYYTIAAQSTPDWEVGIGTYTASGTLLSRNTILESSNGGAAVDFPAGIKDVFVTYPAERSVYLDSAGAYPVQNTFNTLNAANAVLTAGTISTTPVSGTDLVNKTYVDTIASSGVHFHTPVRVETPSSEGSLNATYNNGTSGVGATLTNAGTQLALVIDGVTVSVADRVLVYNQTNATQNGVYVVTNTGSGSTNWILTRSDDTDTYGVDSPESLSAGSTFFVTDGNTGKGETYTCNTVGVITFGTTNITFAQISSAQIYSAGTGLTLTNTTFSITNTGTAGTYGSASNVPVFTTNAQGQVTSATNTAIAIAAGAVSGLAASATTDTTNASNITSGTLGTGRISGSYTGITGVGTLAAGTWNGSTIAANYGGTGYSSYTVGDLLYSDTSSTLAKLADVAVGNALISGGVAAAPSWGKIGLATHVDGTLPVANGGTGATTLTANNVILGNGTSAVQVVAPGTTGNVLTSNGTTWTSSALPNVGDVDGPGSSTDNAVARFDGTTGKIIQNSAVTIADDGATVIAANSTSAALRITQVGSGNALLVEDSANPDSTPFVIDAGGNAIAGYTNVISIGDASPPLQTHVTGSSGVVASRWSNNSFGPFFNLGKSRGATVGTNTIVQSNDTLGAIQFCGDDGTDLVSVAASIVANVDGTPGTNDMPGRLIFSTTADGASSPTERMRIDNAGRVGIGGAAGTDTSVGVFRNLTGSTSVFGIRSAQTIQSDVTGGANAFDSALSTQAASFTVGTVNHYNASWVTTGASSAITNQRGFNVAASLTNATNNYGFYSNIASGTGRWNFYAAGSADNYFAGNVSVGQQKTSNWNYFATTYVTPVLQASGGAPGFGADIAVKATDSTASTAPIIWLGKSNTTVGGAVASGWALGQIFWAGADGTNMIKAAGIEAAVDGTPGTNDMPGRLVFSTTADGASSPTEAMRIDSSQKLTIGAGGASGINASVYNRRPILGGVFSSAHYSAGQIQSGVTSGASYFETSASTTAAVFTLLNLRHYVAASSGFGAGSIVTSQTGFSVDSNLTGATNNFGVLSNIASGTGRWNFYAAGSANNYFAGNVGIGTALPVAQLQTTGHVAGGPSGVNAPVSVTTLAGFTGLGSFNNSAIVENIDALYLRKGGSDGSSVGISFASAGGDNYFVGARIKHLRTGSNSNGHLVFETKSDSSVNTTTERMRIFASGGVSIGNTTDPGAKSLSISGALVENVFTITDGAAFEIDPGNGTIQLITLGASRTPKATNFVAGESITLMVDDGSAYTLTWTDATFGGSGVIWETDGGSAPTLSTSGYTTIVLWKVSTQVYGARVGNA